MRLSDWARSQGLELEEIIANANRSVSDGVYTFTLDLGGSVTPDQNFDGGLVIVSSEDVLSLSIDDFDMG